MLRGRCLDGASVIIVAMADADHRQHVASVDGVWRTPHPAQTLSGGPSMRARCINPRVQRYTFGALISAYSEQVKRCRLITTDWPEWISLRVNMRNPIVVSAD